MDLRSGRVGDRASLRLYRSAGGCVSRARVEVEVERLKGLMRGGVEDCG